MPWSEVNKVERRMEFVKIVLSQRYSMSEVCRRFDVSRKTGYKWVARYEEEGKLGLEDRPRAPKSIPHRTPDAIQDRIIETKKKYINWGPKKVLDNIRKYFPELNLPADSTAGEILRKAGLTKSRGKKRRVPADGSPLTNCEKINQVWSIDFKGDFKMGNKKRCYPLTITDNHSRFLLECRGLPNVSFSQTQPWLERVFQEYGLPEVILSDNGTPFASRAAGGLSRLSRNWILLGIRPSRIVPGEPTQNGRHERMHRTLKQEVTHPVGYSMKSQQTKFDNFIAEYNYERSHEGIGRRFPGDVYHSSGRRYSEIILEPKYEEGAILRRVRSNGQIKWRGEMIYISEILIGDMVCLEEVDNDVWSVRFSFHPLGKIVNGINKLIHEKDWHK